MANIRQVYESGAKVADFNDPGRTQSLKTGGGGGTSGFMEPASKEYVDLKLEAAMGRIEGKFDLLNQRMATLEARTPSWWSVLGAVMIGVGVVLAALSYAGDRFDGGIGLADQRQEQLKRDAAQDAVISRLDALLAKQSTSPAPTPGSPSE